ncbi:MAG: hypothetical protein ACHQ50_10480 [Fimbriimonadales bacterium]
MEPITTLRDNSEAMGYVKSLKDSVKRKYASEYLGWIRGGRPGSAPSRGALSLTLWRAVCTNLDALA